MRKSFFIQAVVLFFLAASMVNAKCVEPIDLMSINESVVFCSDAFDVPNGINIVASNVELDCGTAVLRGIFDSSEIGIRVENVNNITIKNCNVITFNIGIFLKNVTNSHIYDNALLKNNIGIRMFDSYENLIENNNDKSKVRAVSAVNSRFNIVMLGNKPVEQGFCDVNACNEYKDMNPCVSGDFYCSSRCTAETDDDCPKGPEEQPEQEQEPETTEAEQELEELFDVEPSQPVQEFQSPKPEREPVKVPLWEKIFVYVATYLVGFMIIQAYIYRNR